MATPKSVWGIDIGQCALKALKLSNIEGELQVEAFDIIEHPKILSQPDSDRVQLIHEALEQFLARNNILGSSVAVAVPGQASFTRFVKLPPVEEKKIPDIVRFEAEQQIPFPIGEVIWRYQTFHDPDSPDVELGIFAMKRVDVNEMLSHFTTVEMPVDVVQMAPLALYNFMTFDSQLASDGATLLADVGADKTDLVVADGARIWNRTVQIGGNNFTEALVRAFKLSFIKAEKLKRTAASSKYARQIFQAMRPVFSDLVQEIQRSVGYYTSLHRETRFKRLIGLGNGFRLPGLQKFLEQNLNIPVVRIDSFNKITPSATVNVPMFTENVLSFAVAYGLALQGLGQTAVTTNLLPQEVARKHLWEAKKWWFAGAAAAVLLGLAVGLIRGHMDRVSMGHGFSQDDIARVNNMFGATTQPSEEMLTRALDSRLSDGQQVRDVPHLEAAARLAYLDMLMRKYNDALRTGEQSTAAIATNFKLLGYHKVWPGIMSMFSAAILEQFPDQKVLTALGEARDEDAFAKALAPLAAKNRRKRYLAFVDSFKPVYQTDIEAGLPNSRKRPGFDIAITLRTPLEEPETDTKCRLLMRAFAAKAAQAGADLEVVESSYKLVAAPAAVGGAPAAAPAATPTDASKIDWLFPEEDATKDTTFTIRLKIAVSGDGVQMPAEPAEQSGR